jgi:hypothetical protein
MSADPELVRSLQPDIARRFLRRHLSDGSVDEVVDLARVAVVDGDANLADDFRRAIVALESTLDRDLPEYTLLAMVEGDANTSLDEPTDAGARAWLEAILVQLRSALGSAAPAPRASTRSGDPETV